jgi:putative spermidine/putrescine transport system permease protein
MAGNTANPTVNDVMLDASGIPLKVALAKAEKSKRQKAFLLAFPLLIFILVSFIYPITLMLFRSVDNPAINANLPNFSLEIQSWDGQSVPDERIFAILADDLRTAAIAKNQGKVATRLNYDIPGARSMITGTARKIKKKTEGPYKEWFIETNKRWGELSTWVAFQKASQKYTLGFYLNSLDMRYSESGEIVSQHEDLQIYKKLFWRTLIVSLSITVICILLAYPISFLMATLPLRTSNLLMILVLLPFWTSLLVRTTSWIVLLQTQGTLNDLMVYFGIIGDENRIQMIYNMTGTIVAMTHILLPFMVLPLFSVMKTIPPSYMRAARSMGANPAYAWWRVYMPLTLPGIAAGSILVFILSVGYYITPALVGGQSGTLISNLIAFHMQKSLNWGLAAALGTVLLAGILLIYWAYNKIIGIDNMKMG